MQGGCGQPAGGEQRQQQEEKSVENSDGGRKNGIFVAGKNQMNHLKIKQGEKIMHKAVKRILKMNL